MNNNTEMRFSALSQKDYDASLEAMCADVTQPRVFCLKGMLLAGYCGQIMGDDFDWKNSASWGTHHPLHGLSAEEIFAEGDRLFS